MTQTPGPVEGTREWFDELITDRHPGTRHLVRYFAHAHLPEGPIRHISAWHGGLALKLVDVLDDGPELTAGLRRLLEAKDCFVRAMVDQDGIPRPEHEPQSPEDPDAHRPMPEARCPVPGEHPPHEWDRTADPARTNPTGTLFQVRPSGSVRSLCRGQIRRW